MQKSKNFFKKIWKFQNKILPLQYDNKIYEYGSWMGYVCKRKPYYTNGKEVFQFNDFID